MESGILLVDLFAAAIAARMYDARDKPEVLARISYDLAEKLVEERNRRYGPEGKLSPPRLTMTAADRSV